MQKLPLLREIIQVRIIHRAKDINRDNSVREMKEVHYVLIKQVSGLMDS